MSEPVPSCPRCAELLERIAQLEQQVRTLEARLGQNASNSSLPPSANPPDAPKPVTKKRTGKATGGAAAHPGPDDPEPSWHQFAELPRLAAVVTEFQGHARTCPGCGHVTRQRIPAEVRAHT